MNSETPKVEDTGVKDAVQASTPSQSFILNQPTISAEVEYSIGSSASIMSNMSSEPRNFRLLGDIYNEIEEIEVDEEMLMLSIEEPTTYVQAAKEKEWREVMESELISIEKKNSWVLMDLPHGHKAIGLKWVLK